MKEEAQVMLVYNLQTVTWSHSLQPYRFLVSDLVIRLSAEGRLFHIPPGAKKPAKARSIPGLVIRSIRAGVSALSCMTCPQVTKGASRTHESSQRLPRLDPSMFHLSIFYSTQHESLPEFDSKVAITAQSKLSIRQGSWSLDIITSIT